MKDRYTFLETLNRYFYANLILAIISILNISNLLNGKEGNSVLILICSIFIIVYTWNLYAISGNKKMKFVFFTYLLLIGISFSVTMFFPSLLNAAYQDTINSGATIVNLDDPQIYFALTDFNSAIIMVTLSLLIIYIIINIAQIYLSLSFFKEEIDTTKIKSLYPVMLIVSIVVMITEIVLTTIYSPLGALGSSSTLSSIIYIYYLYVCRRELKLNSKIDSSTLNNYN